jgi:hypothetical protein
VDCDQLFQLPDWAQLDLATGLVVVVEVEPMDGLGVRIGLMKTAPYTHDNSSKWKKLFGTGDTVSVYSLFSVGMSRALDVDMASLVEPLKKTLGIIGFLSSSVSRLSDYPII